MIKGGIMVKADVSSLGGRIRKSRIDKHMKMKDFAKMIGITPNYLGLVERGVKQPSPQLLVQIAENVDVPYTWLLNGVGCEPPEMEEFELPLNYTVASVDLQLLLPIIMAKLSYDKEMMARFMGISTADIEKIISGKAYEFNPSWEGILSGLAQTIDLEALVSQLRTLVGFFHNKQEEKINFKLYASIKKYADGTHGIQYQQIGKTETEDEYISDGHGDYWRIFPKQTTLISENKRKWIFKYYPSFDNPEPCIETAGAVLDAQKESYEDRLSLILDNEYIYHIFCNCYKNHHGTCDAGGSYSIDPNIQIFSFILIDKETLEFVDIQTFDPDEPS